MANDRAAMLQQLRDRLVKKKGGFRRDPGEWRAPQVGLNEEFKAKAYILPPVEKGEMTESGPAEVGMDGLFFVQVGDHWIDRKKYPCPRVYDNDACPYCQLGFSLLSETDDKTQRSEISRAYLPRTQYVVNLFFPDIKTNPDELRGRVVYYAMPKTIFDKLEECIQLDSSGDDPDDPQAWGIFYDPNDAYPLSIVINKKGDFNSYVDSKFLAAGKGPIGKNKKEIDAILAMRHDLVAKFPERDQENRKALQGFVDALYNGAGSSDDNGGFDVDEVRSSKTETSNRREAPSLKSDPEPDFETEELEEEEEENASNTASVDDDELDALLDSLKRN